MSDRIPDTSDLLSFLDSSTCRTQDASATDSMVDFLLEPRSSSAASSSQASAPSSTYVPGFLALRDLIIEELRTHTGKLLALNRSRRQAVCERLDRLAGMPVHAVHNDSTDTSAERMKRWFSGHRTQAQNAALQTFFEEVALVSLSQAVLLKAWSDRAVRPWNESDLGQLNWTLSTSLKPHIPLDRDNWHVTCPNLYSWYNPSAEIQKEIWETLKLWKLSEEGPHLFLSLIHLSRQANPEVPETLGYDLRFYRALWESVYSPHPSVAGHRYAFCPTLRDGALVRSAPSFLNWVGLEASPFQLILAELIHLWWGPAAPPLWSNGSGLEVHTRDQLSLDLTSPKPSLLSRIAEMEACELAIVLEERIVRSQGRASESQRFKMILDAADGFKNIRVPTTSLGDLQALVAIGKLRPGGKLVWAREEPLSNQDGTELLRALLEKGKLLCEWDFSEIEHSLPSTVPVFPKHLYLFERESRVEERLAHRPLRINIRGQLRSHVELPHFLSDSLSAFKMPVAQRGQWNIAVHLSPQTQKDWVEHWPDPACQRIMQDLEKLRENSTPLAQLATIRSTPDGDPAREKAWHVPEALQGFWISAECTKGERKLVAKNLPHSIKDEARGSGFMVLVSDPAWVAPLRAYFESQILLQWLDHHAERRGEKWMLNESLIRYIPVPKQLLKVMAESFAGEWEVKIARILENPKFSTETQTDIAQSEDLRSALFVRVSRAIEQLKNEQSRLFALIDQQGQIDWKQLLKILPSSEMVSIPLHSLVQMQGNIPPHFPINQITRVKSPKSGILLATETGMSLLLASESQLVVEMLWTQVSDLQHPTWSEILQLAKLPRRIEIAEKTAQDLLRVHGEKSQRLKELSELLIACSRF